MLGNMHTCMEKEIKAKKKRNEKSSTERANRDGESSCHDIKYENNGSSQMANADAIVSRTPIESNIYVINFG